MELTITCPKCKAEIELTRELAGPLLAETRKELTAQIDAARKTADDAVAEAKRKTASVEAEIEARVRTQADELRVQAQMQAQGLVTAAERRAEELSTKLTEAQKAQADAVRKERELADRERELDLTVERRVSSEVNAAASKAETAVDERYKLKLLERDTQIASMTVKIDELKQKAEQGSQQLQGEAQELDLEQGLRLRFPHDVIGEVAKGIKGADVMQAVTAPSGAQCGIILYESKRTKNWSAGWLPKLREDGRAAKADILVLVTSAMPDDVVDFDTMDGVWVCSPRVALPLATALRMALLQAHGVRQAQEGMKTKSEEVYAYVTGPQFRHRVEALVEAFTAMQADLDAERRAMQRQWSKREGQIVRVMESTAGFFGDLQGIAGGKALPEPAGLELL